MRNLLIATKASACTDCCLPLITHTVGLPEKRVRKIPSGAAARMEEEIRIPSGPSVRPRSVIVGSLWRSQSSILHAPL